MQQQPKPKEAPHQHDQEEGGTAPAMVGVSAVMTSRQVALPICVPNDLRQALAAVPIYQPTLGLRDDIVVPIQYSALCSFEPIDGPALLLMPLVAILTLNINL